MIVDDAKLDTKLPSIMHAAVRLFVEKGVDGTTIRDIARRADVAEGTLYRHFESKDDLARWILVENLRVFTAHLDRRVSAAAGLEGRIAAVVEAFIEAYEENGDLARFILLSPPSEMKHLPRKMRTPRHVVLEILRGAVSRREVSAKADLECLQAMLLGALSRLLLSLVYGEVRGGLRSRSKEISRRCLALVLG